MMKHQKKTWISLVGGVFQKKDGPLTLHEVYNYSRLSTETYDSESKSSCNFVC